MAKEPREPQETDADRIPDSGTGELDTDRLKQREPLEADAGDDDIDDEVDDEVDDAEDDEQPV
jgi:hypothetical protein